MYIRVDSREFDWWKFSLLMFFRSECFKTTTLKKIQLTHDHDQDGPFERKPLIFSVSKVHHNTYQTQSVYSICQFVFIKMS